MSSKKGVIYILSNPSFEEYIKIGYATNIEERLKQLNRSEAVFCIPSLCDLRGGKGTF